MVVESRGGASLQAAIDELSTALQRDCQSRSRRAMNNAGGRPRIDSAPIIDALRSGKSVAEIAERGLACEGTIRQIKRAAGL